MKQKLNSLIVLCLLLAAGLACGEKNEVVGNSTNAALPQKLDSYKLKGLKFTYYKIPAGLKGDALIETAQKIHDADSDSQLILVDDDSRVSDYIKYVKAISGQGETDGVELPKEWADKHIIANVQRYMSGKFVLCEGNGYREIADLK